MEFNLRIPHSSPTKFTSVFRLDGVPILPPLMTAEKRMQMQLLREKAIEMEKKRKDKLAKFEHMHSLSTSSEEGNVQNKNASRGNESNRSYDFGCTLKAMEDSYILLSKLVIDNENDTKEENRNPAKDKDILAMEVQGRGYQHAKLMKSDTIIYDNITNSVIVPMSSTDSKSLLLQQQEVQQQHQPQILQAHKIPAINIDPPTPLVTTRSFSDNLDLSFIESIASTSEDLNQDESKSSWLENYAIRIQRSATSPSLKEIANKKAFTPEPSNTNNEHREQNPLVRSNSFTVAIPSKVLLDHMERQLRLQDESFAQTHEEQQQLLEVNTPKKPQQNPQKTFISRSAPSSSITRHTIESKAKRVQKTVTKPPKVNSNVKACLLDAKSKRSPYEQIRGVKLKASKVLKNNVKAKVTQAQILARNSNKTSPKSVEIPEIPQKLPSPTQGEQHQKLMQLLALQQEQQRIMQQNFEIERNILLEELAQDTASGKISEEAYENLCTAMNPNHSKVNEQNNPSASSSKDCRESSPYSIDNSRPHMFVENVPPPSSAARHVCDNSSIRTPRRRLFASDISPLGLSPSNINEAAGTPSLSSSSFGRRLDMFEKDHEIRTMAATKINSGVRGFLTRRLFHTEHVQRIVQTIKDTLFFVLSLHMEARENPQEGNKLINIQLKTRLIQQLLSATKTLHMVFFDTTIKERLEIISRDRKRLKMKLIAEMKKQRSPRKSPGTPGLRA